MEIINPMGLDYPIYVYEEPVALFSEQLYRSLAEHSKSGKTLIITDSEVYRLYQESINLMCEDQQISCYVIPAGENSKSIEEAAKIWSYMAEHGFHRKDQIIAFGGGVVGDLSGFIASSYMRGIKWIQVPTTLLSQIDSSVGGKVAINLPEGKNLVGSFYNPESVWICTTFLKTLPDETFRDGLGEMFKYGYLADTSILNVLDDYEIGERESSETSLRDRLQANMMNLVIRCLHIKLAIVIKDFTETKERKFLNLGHTVGHAIESHEAYAISHGHAVMLGIWWIIQLGASLHVENHGFYEALLSHHENRMSVYGFKLIDSLEAERLIEYIKMDKKAKSNEVQLVMFNEVKCFIDNKDPQRLEDSVAPSNLEGIQYETILDAVESGFRLETVSTGLILKKIKEIQNRENPEYR